MSNLKKKGKKKYKKKAWSKFSEYIRRRSSSIEGFCKCVTCGKTDHYKKMQAGHFVDSRNNSVLFDERLVHVQCPGCNLFKRGNKIQYVKYMLTLGFSMDELYEFDNLKFATKKYTEQDYKDIYETYKHKVDNFNELDSHFIPI